jgi:hypothetical protein
MIVILKSIFKNYPDKIKQDKIMKKEREIMLKIQEETKENNTLL